MLGNKWFDDQRVGEVSSRSGRGKHTTRNVSLLPVSEGGYLADTPGFNQPSLLKVTKHSLAHCFPEVCSLYPFACANLPYWLTVTMCYFLIVSFRYGT